MIFVLIIITVITIMYWKTLSYGYCMDDYEIAKRSVGKETSKSILTLIHQAWAGTCYKHPRLPHLITFLLHLANSLLVYYAFGCNWISFLTALLFSIHPAGTQGSIWLSGKGYSTVTFFTLLMWSFKWLAPISFILALKFGGFSGILAPLLFLGSSFWFWSLLIPVGVILLWKTIKKLWIERWNTTPKLTRTPSLKRSIIYFKTLGYYTMMALFPFKLGVYHQMLYTYGLSVKETNDWHKIDLYSILGLGVIGLTLFCLLFYPTLGVTLGLSWFVLLMSQWCNFPITIQQSIAERYIYLPLIGAMYALVNAIYLIPDPLIRTILLTTFIVGYLVRLYLHIPSYRNIHFQIDHNLVNFPDAYAVWTWKGMEEKNRGAFFSAIEAWFQGWKLRKHDFRLNNNIAVLLTHCGQLDQAMTFLNEAEKNIPPDQMELGMSYINKAKAEIEELKKQRNKVVKSDLNSYLPGDK